MVKAIPPSLTLTSVLARNVLRSMPRSLAASPIGYCPFSLIFGGSFVISLLFKFRDIDHVAVGPSVNLGLDYPPSRFHEPGDVAVKPFPSAVGEAFAVRCRGGHFSFGVSFLSLGL